MLPALDPDHGHDELHAVMGMGMGMEPAGDHSR
jgi:hypothetical protein